MITKQQYKLLQFIKKHLNFVNEYQLKHFILKNEKLYHIQDNSAYEDNLTYLLSMPLDPATNEYAVNIIKYYDDITKTNKYHYELTNNGLKLMDEYRVQIRNNDFSCYFSFIAVIISIISLAVSFIGLAL